MPFEQTITIINNSGKIISTGKHLVGIFKEARSAYKEKKEALRQEHSVNFRRARTFSVSRGDDYHGPIVEEYDDNRSYGEYDDSYRRDHRALGHGPAPLFLKGGRGRRLSLDDEDRRSHVSSGSRHRDRFRRSSAGGDGISTAGRSARRPTQPPLTARNLRTVSEVSAARPLAAPLPHRNDYGPYAESTPRDMVLSRPALNGAPSQASFHTQATPAEASGPPAAALSSPRASMMVHHPRSDPALSLRTGAGGSVSLSRPIDMNLAYGNIPPDLESRVDLDLVVSGGDEAEGQKESQAKTLVGRIEALLNEAQCIHHTAASIIRHLEDNPEAAAAVALTLAELSALLAKLSPAFLGVVKGGSPAVFALLASPQFLIGTSIAVGVTVILFGGWKIIKRISEVRAARKEEKQAFEMSDQTQHHQPQQQQQQQQNIAGPYVDPALLVDTRAPTSTSGAFDEALVLDEELSTIESWRRGIEPLYDCDGVVEPWESSKVDIELISPEAMRSRIGDDDEHTLRSARTRHTTKSHGDISLRRSRSRHSPKHHRDSARKGKKAKEDEGSLEVPERQSSRDFQGDEAGDTGDTQSQAGNRHRNHSRRDRHAGETVSEAGSVGTNRSSHHSGRSSSRKDGSRVSDKKKSRSPSTSGPPLASPTLPPDAGTAWSRDKKNGSGGNMLKQLFKKKRDKDDKEREDAVSVLV